MLRTRVLKPTLPPTSGSIVRMSGSTQRKKFRPDKVTVARARKIQRFLTQPFFVAEVFTGREGRYVSIKDTVRGFGEILEGKYDDLPEQAFYMVGNIEEAVEAAEKMRVEVAG